MTVADSFTRPPHLLDEEQVLLRDTTARLAANVSDSDPGGATEWSALADIGFTSLRHPSADGTPLGRVSDVLVVVEELARHLSGAPFVTAGVIAPEMLRRSGMSSNEIDEVCSGQTSPAGAPGDPLAVVLGSDLQWSGGGSSDGIAWAAGSATTALYLAGDGALGVVDLADAIDTPDLTRTSRRATGRRRPLLRTLDQRQAAEVELLAMLCVAADSLGVAEQLLEDAVDYAAVRVQFGVPIGSFQAVQHLLSEAYVSLEGLRSALAYAAWCLDGEREERVHAVRVAKQHANVVGVDVVHAAMQVTGGIAITWEHSAHRALRRVVTNREVLGSHGLRQLVGSVHMAEAG